MEYRWQTICAVSDNPPPSSPNGGDGYIIILGEVTDGGKFRPSDWSDRLHGALRALGEEADDYAKYVQLVNYNGKRGVMVDMELENISPQLYRFYTRFAEDNKLLTRNISRQDWISQQNAAG